MEKVFKALSDRSRLKILNFIVKQRHGAVCCDIADYIKKDVSTTFRHLIILEKAGLIKTKKQGKFLACSIKNPKKVETLLKAGKNIRGDDMKPQINRN